MKYYKPTALKCRLGNKRNNLKTVDVMFVGILIMNEYNNNNINGISKIFSKHMVALLNVNNVEGTV